MPIPRSTLRIIVVAILTSPTGAETFRVEPGTNWSHLRPGPGDIIELLPGRHNPASLSGLTGTEEAPIIIRGADPEDASVIAAGNYGLHLQRPRWVVLHDFAVEGARQNGINIDDQDGRGTIGEPWEAHLLLRSIAVRDTGPTGNFDGIKLSGLRAVRVEHCTVEGWGGSAIDMVGCHEVTITGSTFRGKDGYSQSSGIQIKGGSTRVSIDHCRFESAGARAINLGGSTGLAYFRPPVPADAKPGSWFEAEDVGVTHCVFTEGECAIAFVGSRRATITNCTIVNPARWPLRILQETRDPRFGPAQGPAIEHCIIVAESLRTPVNIGDGTEPGSFRWGPNLWWADGLSPDALRRSLPGSITVEQTVRDPELDESYRPASEPCRTFGVEPVAAADDEPL